MQKKFWSALLSLAMIVSCFSGVTLASGKQEIGLPSQQMSAPSNVNIDMKETSRITVRVPYSGSITLTGTVMAQGTESPTLRMDTARVNELYKSVTGYTGSNETLLMGEVVNANPVYSSSWFPNSGTVSTTGDSTFKYLAKEFKPETGSTIPRLWAVGSDGSFSVTFVPEVHTTKYYGFTLSSLYEQINVAGNTYGVFESLYTTSQGTVELGTYNAAKDLLGVFEEAYDDVKGVVDAYSLKLNELKTSKATIDDLLDDLEASADLALNPVTQAAYGENTDYNTATGQAYIEWGGTADQNTASTDLKNRIHSEASNLKLEMEALLSKLTSYAPYDGYMNLFLDPSISLYGIHDDMTNVDLAPLGTNTSRYQAMNAITAIDDLADVIDGLNTTANFERVAHATSGVNPSLLAAASALTPVISNVQSLVYIVYGETHMGGSQANLTDMASTLGTAWASSNIQTNGSNLENEIDTSWNAATDIQSTLVALETAVDGISGYVTALWTAYENAANNITTLKVPADRYIQNTPLQVRYMYKLSDSAMTYPAGTSGNHVISGTIVTSDDQTIPYDFNYEIREDSASGQLIATGRTQNGYFSFTMNTMFNKDIILYPTERYGYVPNSGYGGGGSNQFIPLDLSNPADQFPYTVATPQRRDFIKAELDETTMTSEIVSKAIKFTDLYTYNEALNYSVLDSQVTSSATSGVLRSVTASGFNGNLAEVYLYGVSYVVYDEDGNALGKDYTINSSGNTSTSANVTWSWAWNKPSTSLIDSTSTTNTPLFVIDDEGYLAVPMNGSYRRAYFSFTSSGNATMRVRQTGRQNIGTAIEQTELYQVLKTIYVEAPGQVTVVAGHELKYLSKDKTATLVQLHSLSNDIKSVRMSKITYDDKADIKHTLEAYTTHDGAKANAKGTTLTYYLNGNDIYMYMPWDLVKQGGSDIEITCDFLDTNGYLVTSRVITIKNLLWKVTSEQQILNVQETNTFDAIVTDGDDIEQNSAMLKLVDDNNPSITSPLARNVIRNIVGGRYTFNNARPMAGGDVYLFVQETTGEESGIKAMATLQALGKADIDAVLTEGKDKVVTGLAKTLEFTATNAAGSAETGLVNAQLYSLDGVTKNTNFADYDSLKLVHAGSGKYTISLVNLKPGSYILRVSTMNMTHYADIEFEALPLTIEYPDDFGILTWDTTIAKNSNFYDANKMEFKVIDPMTDNEVYVEIKDDIAFVLENGDESEMGAVLRAFETGSTTRYINDYTVSFSDKDFLPYNMKSNRSSHEFWVGLVDDRSDVVRAEEGDLSLRFNFVVRENNSTGASHDVEGMVIPIGLPTLEVNPESVNRNTTTTVTLTVKDANGRPASGVQIRPDVEAVIAARTNADGETQYLFTPMVTGNTKRFDIAGFEGSAQVYAILNIVDDSEAPVIALNPYISKTTRETVEISGIVSDNLGLQLFTVDNTMVNMTLTGKTSYEFAFNVTLRVGENKFRMVVQDNSGLFTEKTITIVRNMPSVVIMTLGSTEVIGATGLDVEPVVSNGRTMLPIRFIFQDILGGEVGFDPDTQTITANVMGHTIVMTVGSNQATVDGATVTLLTAPYIVEEAGRTLAPIREILEAIGVKVDFEAVGQTVTITGGGDVDEYTDTDLIAPAGATVGNTEEEVIDETDETEEIDETEEVDETEETEEVDETEETEEVDETEETEEVVD